MGQAFRVVVGAGVKCTVNGQTVGEVTSFSWDSDTEYKEINGLDSNEPAELAQTRIRVSGQVGLLRIRNMGGLEGRGLKAKPADSVREKYNTIEIIDKSDGRVLFHCDSAVIPKQRWTVLAKQMVTGSFTFVGTTWVNSVTG